MEPRVPCSVVVAESEGASSPDSLHCVGSEGLCFLDSLGTST